MEKVNTKASSDFITVVAQKAFFYNNNKNAVFTARKDDSFMKFNLKVTNFDNPNEDLAMNTQSNSDAIEMSIRCLDGEKWKICEGFEDYWVSNYGRVYSTLRKKILKPDLQKTGYYDVRIKNRDGSFIHKKPHNLVGCAFCPNPEHKLILHHINGDSRDNSSKNLMWVNHDQHCELHKKMREEKKKALEEKSAEGASTNELAENN